MRILIAEDDRTSRRVLEAIIAKWGYEVVVTCGGVEAFEALRSEDSPKLAILDWMMPDIDGVEVCRKIRKIQTLQPTYIILLTTKGSKTDIVEGFEAGVDDYVTKPFNRAELRARIRVGERILELQSKLRKYSETLEQRVQERTVQLETANRAKSDFLASMSHELRTPLNAIIGFSEVLQEQYFGPLNNDQGEYIKNILGSGEHLLTLINDILDMTQIKLDNKTFDQSEFSLREALENSPLLIKERALYQNLRVTTEIDSQIGSIVGEKRKIKQVLFNLLSNAAKFTPNGGAIHLKALLVDSDKAQTTEEQLEVDRRREGCVRSDSASPDVGILSSRKANAKWVQISVEDTGIGIATEEQDKIFEAFYQVQSGFTDKTPGTGLGLSLCKQFVEMHGGRIWVESEGLDRGSQFSFVLPIYSAFVEE